MLFFSFIIFLCEFVRERSDCLVTPALLLLWHLVHWMRCPTCSDRHVLGPLDLEMCVVGGIDHHSSEDMSKVLQLLFGQGLVPL